MARLPRLTIAHFPHHIILRGNNRQDIFKDAEDHRRMSQLLRDASTEHKVALHGYVQMPNHMHLLLTPETIEGVPRLMQALGRSYVRYFNARHGRTGTLWEGRYRSSLIEAAQYLLACMVYLDLTPVHEGLAPTPGDYVWSSHAHYVGLRPDPLITPHPHYWELGNTPFAREAAYAALVRAGQSSEEREKLTKAAQSGWALGSESFFSDLQRRTERRVKPAQPGRPRKAPNGQASA